MKLKDIARENNVSEEQLLEYVKKTGIYHSQVGINVMIYEKADKLINDFRNSYGDTVEEFVKEEVDLNDDFDYLKKRFELLTVTTDSLQGYEIEEYLGYVDASLVLAAGLATDFFTSFSDTFGGYSQSNINKINELKDKTINLLKKKGLNMGATALLGLKVDVEAVTSTTSGAAGMYICNATATAVRCSKNN